ncbi:hypothetical protein BT96DRAFT_993381 [Gymnopus androsaceus JB14]|uniref:Uncharacterized protein n=1 Tax=Gymnopus androsaceus JB14 TaxID=1447944 RepID=A0A6A4HM90_9AGAR|nr:hypothetical protein BT96DRAFT_993381 [Gymnopus androsaceus JB14]
MAMHEILRIMMQMTKWHGGKGTNRGFDFWTRPGQYDYRKAFATTELACTAAIRSKYAFIPLITTLTYYALLCKAYWVPESSTLMEVSQTAWIQYIAKKSRYQEECVWMLISTLLVKTKRVGGVIDMKSCGFIHSIPLIQEFDPNCIILLHWGEDFDIRQYPTMINIKTPSEEQVIALRHQKKSRSIHTFPDRQIDTEQIYGRHIPPKERLPWIDRVCSQLPALRFTSNQDGLQLSHYLPVEIGSGQLDGEEMLAFFERCTQWSAEYKQTESKIQRRNQEDHAAIIRKNAMYPSTTSGITIWGYEDIIWADFAPENRRFDDIRLEWDLCHDFKNAIVIHSASNPSTPQQPMLTMEPLTLDNKQTAPLFDVATPELDNMASDLQEMLPLAYKLTIAMDQAQVYYGMVKIESPINHNFAIQKPMQLYEIGILCGQERTTVENLAVPLKVLQDFFGIMNEAKMIAEIPSKIWLPLDEREQFQTVIRSLGVWKEILNGTIHYILDPQQEGPDQKLTLIIPDA